MTTSHNPDADLDAVLDRLRRLETRLCKLMLHMGLGPSGEPVKPLQPLQPLDHEPIQVQNANVLKRMLESLRTN